MPYFLEKFKGKPTYPGKNNMYILFPDHGAYSRYATSVRERLKLDWDHILTLISLLLFLHFYLKGELTLNQPFKMSLMNIK